MSTKKVERSSSWTGGCSLHKILSRIVHLLCLSISQVCVISSLCIRRILLRRINYLSWILLCTILQNQKVIHLLILFGIIPLIYLIWRLCVLWLFWRSAQHSHSSSESVENSELYPLSAKLNTSDMASSEDVLSKSIFFDRLCFLFLYIPCRYTPQILQTITEHESNCYCSLVSNITIEKVSS